VGLARWRRCVAVRQARNAPHPLRAPAGRMGQGRRADGPGKETVMVYLSRIYTGSGDKGETGLGDGTRVPKDNPRVAAYGSVDELNAVLGLLRTLDPQAPEAELLRGIQNDLFDVGADLCLPQPADEPPGKRLRVGPERARGGEAAIDRLTSGLAPLNSFVLPGGQPAAAWCHLARPVCRRAEREVVALTRREPVNPQVIVYLNRLS